MKNWTKQILMTLGIAVLGSAMAIASEPRKANPDLLAKTASSSAEHSEVAKLYSERADDLIKKAAVHEKKAAQLQAQQHPINYKWPAMSQKPWEKELRLAMQARRAAEEAKQLSAKHTDLAADAGTKTGDLD